MKVLAFDVETSGLPLWDKPSNHILQPYICSLGYVLFDPLLPDMDIAIHELIKPADWGVSAEAQAIHGLSVEHLTAHGRPIKDVLDRFLIAYDLADRLTGFNLGFDLKMLRGALKRDGRPDRRGEKPELCCMQAVRPYINLAPTDKMMAAGRYTSKTPKLIEAYRILLGKQLEGAHDALADARAVVELYRWLLATGRLPMPDAKKTPAFLPGSRRF